MRIAVALALALLVAAPPAARADDRSEGVATLYSLGGTAVPIGVFWAEGKLPPSTPRAGRVLLTGTLLATLEIGPAAGHWYAGDYWTTGMAVRSAGLLTIVAAVALDDDDECDKFCLSPWPFVGLLGAITVVTGAGIDLASSPAAARRYNEAHPGGAPREHVISIGGRF